MHIHVTKLTSGPRGTLAISPGVGSLSDVVSFWAEIKQTHSALPRALSDRNEPPKRSASFCLPFTYKQKPPLQAVALLAFQALLAEVNCRGSTKFHWAGKQYVKMEIFATWKGGRCNRKRGRNRFNPSFSWKRAARSLKHHQGLCQAVLTGGLMLLQLSPKHQLSRWKWFFSEWYSCSILRLGAKPRPLPFF